MVSSVDTSDGVGSDNEESKNSHGTALMQVLKRIRNSFFVFTIAVGVVTAVLGATPLFEGANAGLLGIVGVSLILYGFLGIGILKLIGYSG